MKYEQFLGIFWGFCIVEEKNTLDPLSPALLMLLAEIKGVILVLPGKRRLTRGPQALKQGGSLSLKTADLHR